MVIESLPSDPAGKSGQAISQHQTLAAIIKSIGNDGQHPGNWSLNDFVAAYGGFIFHRAAVVETTGRRHHLSTLNALDALNALGVGVGIGIADGVGMATAVLKRFR